MRGLTVGSLVPVTSLVMEPDGVLLLIASLLREFPLSPGLVVICFLVLDVVWACLLIVVPMPLVLLELFRLLRLAAD